MAEDKSAEPVLVEAREQFKQSQDDTNFNRNDAHDDIIFARLGEQWPDKVKAQRVKDGRPCLTINKLPSFIRQVVNDARQNKPGIAVGPVDNGADKDTAEVISGLIRSIERKSHADVAYDTAIDHSVSGGFGFFRIGIDYCHEDSFDMEAKIERIPNPLMVHWDPNSTAFDASDWSFGFVSDFLTEDQFETRYPKAEKVSFEGDDKDQANYWLDDDNIRVAEYWSREEKTRKLLLLSNGQVFREDAYKDEIKAFIESQGVTVQKDREVRYFTVTRRIISGVEILEEDDWPGSLIPICPVWGDEVIVDGKRHFRSMIRDARDPQTMFNFWRSATTELVALAPRVPWIGPKGFIPKGQESLWQSANTRSHAYLEYEGTTAPQRQPFANVPAGALQEALNASDDIKAIIGIYDPSLGARSNETSGKAILARQREADNSNFHFTDNLNRAIAYAGRVLVEIIPSVYSARQTIRILGEDETENVVNLARTGTPAQNGQGEKLYDLSVGKYDVTVKSGPSYSTQREETREMLMQIMQAVPNAAPFIGDLLAEHLDFVGADKLAKRLQMLLPPQIQKAEGIEAPQMPQAQPNPLEIEKVKAQIENLRASAIANMAKAGATHVDSQLAEIEAVLNALNTLQPQPTPGAQTPPGQPAAPSPMQGNGFAS